jgi:hypothetical protein
MIMHNGTSPDWRSDSVYSAIFRKAENAWDHCRRAQNDDHWQYVLIEEWSEAEGPRCGGKIIRAWVRDAKGLQEISLQEYNQQKRKINSPIYPFIIVQFHLPANRKHVVFGTRYASLAGQGTRYVIEGEGDTAKLVPDPTAGFWES